ncbi:MAG TPA: RodZ domain-containing protein [Azospira sp.]|nr:RodZ domain-containing protein [Azospira sp.]
MSDAHNEGVVEEIAVAPQPSVGERLRAGREAKGMSTADIAATLKLSPRQIDALEADDWSGLPGNAFVRGFVRNYARVVQLDVEALLADLDMPAPPPPRLDPPRNATAVMPQAGQAQKRDYAAVLAGMVLVAVAAVAYFVVPPDFWVSTPADKPAESAANASAAPQPLFPPAAQTTGDDAPAPLGAAANAVPPGAAPLPSAALTEPAVQDAAVRDAAKLPAAVVPPVTDAAKPGEAGPARDALKFGFAQPSWVEIRDRSGQIIFSQLNPAGSERLVEGQPPFVLVVGNASHVTLSYKGRAVELQPRSRDDVARVTVE